MKSEFVTIQLPKVNRFQRLLAMLLSLIMVFSLCGTEFISIALAAGNTQQETPTETKTETREEIKSRLMRQIRYEGWDPYSSDMTLEEFYALMELFDEGKLPLASPGYGAPVMEGPSIEGEANVIPRTLFMFKGLPTKNEDGSPFEYQDGDAPLPYDDDNTYPNYPSGLDPYGLGYQVPPTSWAGVPLGIGKSQVVISVEGQNDDNDSISGNVVQSLFKDYITYGYYVRRVTVESTEAAVLGAIKLSGENNYVYYYLTDENQNTMVSTTKLEDGKKFIIEYSPIEHTVEYEVRWDELGGEEITSERIDANVLGTDLSDIWENIIFGTSHLDKTDGSAYSFTAYAPFGYTVEFYLVRTNEETGTGGSEWGAPVLLLGMDQAGSFKDVNNGWALGVEPNYLEGSQVGDTATILPNTEKGPSTLTMSGNIFNDNVHHDRKIIAVVHKNPDPSFFVAPLKHNTDNVANRGTSAYTQVRTEDGQLVDYDYEDVYLWASGQPSKYQYNAGDPTISGGGKGNIAVGNIATCDSWGWRGKEPYNNMVSMNQEKDGTYSYQWTFQTNNGEGGYTMDSLEINGVAVTIPFLPKLRLRDDYRTGTNGGSTTWHTETDIGNGIRVKVEFLMVFHPGGDPQRVYRITATGARSNVTISAMNLIQGTGAPEFVTYQLAGVTDGNGATAIEYYTDGGAWNSSPQGSITVYQNNTGLNFDGDPNLYGANIRFKLADGYTSPYFLWESTQAGVISGQASATRDDDGNVILTQLNSVKSLNDFNGNTIGSANVYESDDGWYYIRVTTQGNYKVALLTIGAKQLRYVVRYIPGTDKVPDPTGMPTFNHTDEPDFNISQEYAEQYDTASGAYYDVTVDNVIILPDITPSDPNSNYKFVDWVLVDLDGNPIIDKQTGKEFHYRITHINLLEVVDYAFPNVSLGGDATDIYVLRLMPNWEPIEHPFTYTIVLNWVDALGGVHEELFKDWDSSLTDWDPVANGPLAVKVFKDAAPFKEWLLQHPTYAFWDAVNNAADEADVKAALNDYVSYIDGISIDDNSYLSILSALKNMDYGGESGTDDYTRNGSYSFSVYENNGVVAIWMYEDKGYIAITETGGSPNESFLYQITDKNQNTLTVSVKGGGKTIVLAPLGDYTIKAIDDWSWRYENGVCLQATTAPKGVITLKVTGEHNEVQKAIHADYTNKRNDKVWLGGENSKDNRFAGTSTTG